jgi:hypothetical protein
MQEMKMHEGSVHIEPQQFWCDECDENRVDSQQPETGKFYSQFGHKYRYDHFRKEGIIEEWTQVIYAICSSCLDNMKGK